MRKKRSPRTAPDARATCEAGSLRPRETGFSVRGCWQLWYISTHEDKEADRGSGTRRGVAAAYPAEFALELDAGLKDGEYQPTPDELAGIDRGRRAAAEGRFATDLQVEAAFAKFRGQ